jgi:G:T/U-mismatch repair DNA glycosylase
LKTFTSNGFALWDVLESCERKGSLDTAIQKEIPNNIREFCNEHPSIKRIVMANGSTQCTFFNRHFKDWWESGELKPADTEVSKKAFQKYAKKTNNFENASIECLVGLGVSPAAAKFSYKEKRDYYEQYCYDPGLLDQKELNS